MKGPKPLIEEHYHIQELIDRQDKRTADINYHRAKVKEREERDKDIADAPMAILYPFWCTKCHKDFHSATIKQVEQDWSCPSQYIAFYRARHKCGTWCIRLITDKQRDGYFIRSKAVRVDQGKAFNDTLQPWQDGFNLLYGKK